MANQGLSLIITVGATMILARILTPRDYGMMAMVVAITGFANIFINLGLSTATIQRANINHAQVSTLFWINGIISVSLGVILVVSSPLVAQFYERSELRAVMSALSISFVLEGREGKS